MVFLSLIVEDFFEEVPVKDELDVDADEAATAGLWRSSAVLVPMLREEVWGFRVTFAKVLAGGTVVVGHIILRASIKEQPCSAL